MSGQVPIQGPKTRWAILGELAAGGMARVEVARLEGGGVRLVAVKRLQQQLASDESFVTMFLDEVWMTAALKHPNLVELVGWGEDEEGPFLALELVWGAPLGELARAGRLANFPMPPEVVAFVAARAAEGLAAAHALVGADGTPLGLVHRDVTPSNVLVGFDGAVKVTDFGIARALGRSTRTATGIVKGKVAYMSPEQAHRGNVDPRSDLYSLGVVSFELLTGRLPFRAADEIDMLRQAMETLPPRVDTVVPGFDPALASIVESLLAKEPTVRPPDGRAVAAALDGWTAARGHTRLNLERALGAFATRHARARREVLNELLGRPGTPREVELHRGAPERAAPPPPAPSSREVRAGTRRVARAARSVVDDDPPLTSDPRPSQPTVAYTPARPAAAEPAAPYPATRAISADPAGARARTSGTEVLIVQRPQPAQEDVDLPTQTVRMDRPEPRRGPSRLALVGVAALSFVGVLLALSLALALLRGRY